MQVGQKKRLRIKRMTAKRRMNKLGGGGRGRASPRDAGHKLVARTRVWCWGSRWPQPGQLCSLAVPKMA